MTDATISAPPAKASADASDVNDDDAVASVLVPGRDGWEQYRLKPGSRLTVDGLSGETAAIIEADPEPDTDSVDE